MRIKWWWPAALALVSALSSGQADAFCGFYVSGAGADLFNSATQVVLMRQGTRTVLSMQNSYEGPPESFAMVVPVPQVLQKENVKTLPSEVFAKIDRLAAPRLVEYWETDPCAPEVLMKAGVNRSAMMGAPPREDLGVKIEAQFEVGEYDVVILSAKDSSGLDTWLRQEKYQIPAGAEPYLRPYVEAGSKFFVAKVDPKKVVFKDGRAKLSPLRFHYDSDEFSLPIRLGLINSGGTQDLIVHILSPGQRYEVANYRNVTIPTNLELEDAARDRFGAFYAALFDRTLEHDKGAVVTEYAWDSGSCDPCPTPPLDGSDLATLGADVLTSAQGRESPPMGMGRGGMVLTRLHARYQKDAVGEDLVFRAAPPIVGGREYPRTEKGGLETGSNPGSVNNFQGRYIIRHPWTGAIACDKPIRDRWGGPPGTGRSDKTAKAATDLAFAPRGKARLAEFVKADIPDIAYAKSADEAPAPAPADVPAKDTPAPAAKKGCSVGGQSSPWSLAIALALVLPWRRRRRR